MTDPNQLADLLEKAVAEHRKSFHAPRGNLQISETLAVRLMVALRSIPPEAGKFENRWRDSTVTVPCDGDDVLGYWSAARNFGNPHVGYVHYSAKVWHSWRDPVIKCAAPDCWMPISLPSPQRRSFGVCAICEAQEHEEHKPFCASRRPI